MGKGIIQYTFYEPILYAQVVVEIKVVKDGLLGGETRVEERQGKKGKEVRYIIRIESKQDFYTLQHELIHLVKQIFVDRRIPFTAENDEIFAYYYEYWFKKIWRRINK